MPDPLIIPETFDRLQDIMEEAGELDKRVPCEEITTNVFAEEAIRTVK